MVGLISQCLRNILSTLSTGRMCCVICIRPGCLLVLTFAGSGLPAHWIIDTEECLSPYTNDYYANTSPLEFASTLDLEESFYRYSFEAHTGHGDPYFWGIRNSLNEETEHISLEEGLARARGQPSRALSANRELELQILLCNSPPLAVYKLLRYLSRSLADISSSKAVILSSSKRSLWSLKIETKETKHDMFALWETSVYAGNKPINSAKSING